MNFYEVQTGISVRIKKIEADFALRERLKAVGIKENGTVKSLIKNFNGVIAAAGSSQVGLSAETAKKIKVECVIYPRGEGRKVD